MQPTEKITFETAVKRLEAITAEIENPETPIEKSIEMYKEAGGLIKLCTKIIDEAELQVKILLNGEEEV